MPRPSWTEEADTALVRVCIALFKDPLQDQIDPTFWRAVSESLRSELSPRPRSDGALQARWYLLSRDCAYFADCVSHVVNEQDAAIEEDELVEDALTLFRKTTGHHFLFLASWRLLKDWPKLQVYRLDTGVKKDTEAAGIVNDALAASRPQLRSEKRKRQCGCSRSEGCAACGRCLERHCVCGMPARRRRAMCLESRACSCPLMDPVTRCSLCHGCRRTKGDGHCRCVQHQKLWWQRRHPEMQIELTEQEDKNQCNCLKLGDGREGAAGFAERQNGASDKTERLRRVKRVTGLPSSDNIFRKKISVRLGGDGIEIDFDEEAEEDSTTKVSSPTVKEALPRSLARSLLGFHNPPPYHPLFRSEGCTLLETIEPRNEPMRTMQEPALQSHAIQQNLVRGLENLTYELDRTANLPPDDLVDFLVYMASIKASNVGELIGTFEDSAAVAASIILEEYMAQLISDATVKKKAVCSPTESSVTAFTQELLVGFNWQLYQQQNPFSPQSMVDKVAALILREFNSVQPRDYDGKARTDEVMGWIRKAITIPRGEQSTTITTVTGDDSTRTEEEESKTNGSRQNNEEESSQAAPRIRMSVKPHPVFGTPAYKLSYAVILKDGHNVQASVGGIKTKSQAIATIARLSQAVECQEERSRNSPPPPSDPYALMWEFLNQHCIEYKATRRLDNSDVKVSEENEESGSPKTGNFRVSKRRKTSAQDEAKSEN